MKKFKKISINKIKLLKSKELYAFNGGCGSGLGEDCDQAYKEACYDNCNNNGTTHGSHAYYTCMLMCDYCV